MARRRTPMVGRRFGRLLVIAVSGRGGQGQLFFRVRCDCGAELERAGGSLRQAVRAGHSPSCGCARLPRGSSALRPRRGQVTIANYVEVARSFTPFQLHRLAEIMRRHKRAACYFCSTGRACLTEVEAVEAVTLEARYGLLGAQEEPWERVDYARQGMYGR